MTESQPITMDHTYKFTLDMPTFPGLSPEEVCEIFHDGRQFAAFIERWLPKAFPELSHVNGCKDHDHVNVSDETIKYDQKTFTKGGCKYMPSSMIGTGRQFDEAAFQEQANKLIYIIVSNIDFPEIEVRFVCGTDLLITHPKGTIPLKDRVKFFG